MEDKEAPVLTEKAEKTRERIFQTALGLFVEQGYDKTTMRDIAKAAECSLGLTYRYFASKEDLVLSLYERVADEMSVHANELATASLARRFDSVMKAVFARLEPYRDAFGSVLGSALNPKSDVSVLGEKSSGVRRKVSRVFTTAVMGATDAPREPQAKQLATVLFSVHLLLILFWLYDPTPGRRATRQLLALTRDMLRVARRILRLPFVSHVLTRLATAIEPVFGVEG